MGIPRLLSVLAVGGLVGLSCSARSAHEAALGAGPFMAVRGAELGPAVSFSNEVDTHECHELSVDGQHVAWLHRAYSTGGEIFVQRCQESDPAPATEPNVRQGGIEVVWERLRWTSRSNRVEFEPLEVPDWSFVSNPVFCGAHVAYWGWRSGHLVPSIYDLGAAHRTATHDLGTVDVGTDDASFFPAPVWARTCAEARFDAGVVGAGTITLRVAQ